MKTRRRWIVPWVLSASLACHDAPSHPRPPLSSSQLPRPAARAAASAETPPHLMSPARVAELAAFVTKVREHPFKKALPPVRFVPRSDLPVIAGANAAVTQIRTQGRYFDDRHEIAIAEELEGSPDLDRIVVHELVHALMTDWGVTHFVVEGQVHGTLFGRAALVEGDANLIEAAFRDAEQGQSPQRTLAGVTRVHAPWVPLACRADAEAASCGISNALNEDGAAFASALYRAGGVALLDAAHAVPPRSALEILYPDLYLAGVTEVALGGELGSALDAAGTPKSGLGELGAYRLGQTLGSEMPLESLRAFLHELRGAAAASVDKGLVILTEWADDRTPGLVQSALRGSANAAVAPVGKRRLLIGAMARRETVDAVAKHVAAKTAAPLPAPPPFAKPAPPPTWEEELAAGVRTSGEKAFRSVGLELGTKVRRAHPGSSTEWLFGKDDKVFLLPATAPVVTRKLFLRTLEKAWPDRVEAVDDLSVPEERMLPVGAVRLSGAPLATPSILHVAVARIALCGDDAAALSPSSSEPIRT